MIWNVSVFAVFVLTVVLMFFHSKSDSNFEWPIFNPLHLRPEVSRLLPFGTFRLYLRDLSPIVSPIPLFYLVHFWLICQSFTRN